MAITHQEIADRLEALSKEHSKAYEAERQRIQAETRSLQELCGGVGHVWIRCRLGLSGRVACAICGAAKPTAQVLDV